MRTRPGGLAASLARMSVLDSAPNPTEAPADAVPRADIDGGSLSRARSDVAFEVAVTGVASLSCCAIAVAALSVVATVVALAEAVPDAVEVAGDVAGDDDGDVAGDAARGADGDGVFAEAGEDCAKDPMPPAARSSLVAMSSVAFDRCQTVPATTNNAAAAAMPDMRTHARARWGRATVVLIGIIPGTSSRDATMRDEAATKPLASATAWPHSLQPPICSASASDSARDSAPSSHV